MADDLLMPFAENNDLIGSILGRAIAKSGCAAASPRLMELNDRVKAGREAVLAEIRAGEFILELTRREV